MLFALTSKYDKKSNKMFLIKNSYLKSKEQSQQFKVKKENHSISIQSYQQPDASLKKLPSKTIENVSSSKMFFGEALSRPIKIPKPNVKQLFSFIKKQAMILKHKEKIIVSLGSRDKQKQQNFNNKVLSLKPRKFRTEVEESHYISKIELPKISANLQVSSSPLRNSPSKGVWLQKRKTSQTKICNQSEDLSLQKTNKNKKRNKVKQPRKIVSMFSDYSSNSNKNIQTGKRCQSLPKHLLFHPYKR